MRRVLRSPAPKRNNGGVITIASGMISLSAGSTQD